MMDLTGTKLQYTESNATVRGNDVQMTGGKGQNLIRLRNGGFPVPPFVIIPSGMVADLIAPVSEAIDDLLAEASPSMDQNRDAISEQVRQLIASAEIPEPLATLVATFTHQHPERSFAVRSSVSSEDSRDASFAGLFHTVLEVPADDVFTAVQDVVASLYQMKVREYAVNRNISTEELSMAVVIQVMAESAVSGILFTMNPNGNMGRMMLTAGFGAGEGVVNNTTDTTTWLIDRQSHQTFRLLAAAPGDPLNNHQIKELASMALRIEEHFGYAQDIEFTITPSEEIAILQSRDITTINLQEIRILDNSNIVESYPGITLPLTFTFAKEMYQKVFAGTIPYFKPSGATVMNLDEPLSNMIAHVNGRVYYQLHHWYRLISIVNTSGNRMREWENFIGIRSAVRPASEGSYVQKVKMALTSISLLLRYRLIMKAFYRNFEKAYTPLRDWTDKLNQNKPDRETILRNYTKASEELVACWPATLLNDFFVYRSHAALERVVARITGDTDGRITQGLLCGISGVESEWPVKMMLELKVQVRSDPELNALFRKSPETIMEALRSERFSAFYRQVLNYMKWYGDRTLEELKLETLNFRQNSEGFISLLKSQLTGDSTLETFAMRQREIRACAEQEMSHALKGKLWQRLVYRLLLRNTKAMIRNRENMRLRRTRAYGAVKEIFAYVGRMMVEEGILKRETDLFLLTMDHLMAYLEHGTTNGIQESVDQAAQNLIRWREADMPDRIIWQGSEIPIREGIREASGEAGEMVGLGISKGTITAEAIVLEHPDYDAPVDGKILVSCSTDPGWVFLMTRAAGIISEKGSPLSHTAIVGRELGIPVIVGLAQATRRIKTGQQITMDGEKGLVFQCGHFDDGAVLAPNDGSGEFTDQ